MNPFVLLMAISICVVISFGSAHADPPSVTREGAQGRTSATPVAPENPSENGEAQTASAPVDASAAPAARIATLSQGDSVLDLSVVALSGDRLPGLDGAQLGPAFSGSTLVINRQGKIAIKLLTHQKCVLNAIRWIAMSAQRNGHRLQTLILCYNRHPSLFNKGRPHCWKPNS